MERMLWGSDRYSNPVQMVLETWHLSIISFAWLAIVCLTDIMTTFGLASKKINVGFDDYRPLKYQILKSFSGLLKI